MATIELRVDDFEDGVLPRVCASSGAPADGLYRFRATRGSWWPLLLLLAGPVGFVAMIVVMAMFRGHVDGWLPLADDAHRATQVARWRAVRRLAEVIVGVAGVVALLAWQGWTTPMVVVLLVGSLAVGWFVATVFRPEGSLGVTWTRSGRLVTIVDASDEFVAAYRAQESRRVRRRFADVSGRPR